MPTAFAAGPQVPNRAFDVVLANTGTFEALEHEVTRVLGLV